MYKIHILENSYFRPSARTMFLDGQPEERVPGAGFFWVIEGPEHLIAVDTGIGTASGQREEILWYTVEEGYDTLSCLQRIGLRPEQVQTVILTHLHWDHCLNLELFTNAQVVLSSREWANVTRPRHPALATDPPFPKAIVGYLKQNRSRVHFVEEELEVAPGIKVFWVGGHTPGSQAVSVQTAVGTVVIAGDTVCRYENIEQDRVIGLFHSLAECYLGMEHIRERADIVLPNHDPAVLERWPERRIG